MEDLLREYLPILIFLGLALAICCAAVGGWKVEYMPALVPTARRSTLTPSEWSSPLATGQMPNTPIEAVMVVGSATMASPRIAAM